MGFFKTHLHIMCTPTFETKLEKEKKGKYSNLDYVIPRKYYQTTQGQSGKKNSGRSTLFMGHLDRT